MTVLKIRSIVQIMKHKSYALATTVQKAFRLLEILGDKQPARPSEIVKQLALSRSNVYRLFSTLQEMGYVEKDIDLKYNLSFKIFILGNTVLRRNPLAEVARPYMARLAEIYKENVNLGVMYEQKVLYIEKIESPHYLKLDQPIGRTDPLHCTALGKTLLSGLTDQEIEAFLRSTKLVPYTKKTITDPEVLDRVIRNVRRKGYSLDLEELGEGIHCIGAPIRDLTKKVIAAISISAPAIRLTKGKMKKLVVPLIETSLEISKKMGYMESGEIKEMNGGVRIHQRGPNE
jgi:DNA-binding IclR family transcriptional regulator